MSQGTSGTFGINGTDFNTRPSESSWIEREMIGISGEGRPTYPALRRYEMSWELLPMDDFAQLWGFYNLVQSTGTVVVDLPKWATSPFQFYSYSGCTLQEPTVGKFFVDHVEDVTLLVLKVVTQ